jgi:hypothetical protein
MADPYRSAPRPSAAGPRELGIAGEVIGQFADPLAFYRELIQNAIDAGSSAIEIGIAYDESAQAARVTVRDEGEGMTRAIIEDQLLVLFRSTKERDATKIGKFGIGFASVMAAAPRVVVVQTSRAGARLTLHLYPDLSYQLFDSGPATRTGTTVELELPLPAAELPDLARRSREAIVRWCRHATVPITLTARGAGGAPLVEARIDRPLGLEAALLEARAGDGAGLTVVVGLLPEAAPYAGFFNHGLMLHESDEPLLGRLAVKVQDARLGHTLSRDNVRRDQAFARAVAFARGVAERELPGVAAAALRERTGDAYRSLVEALLLAPVRLGDAGWAFPLFEPRGDRRVVEAAALPPRVWGASRRSPVTEALEGAGVPVLDLGTGWLAARVAEACRRQVVDVARELTLVSPVTPTAADQALLAALDELLAAADRRPAELVLAAFDGALAGEPAIAAPRAAPWLVALEPARKNPLRRWRRPPLALGVHHPLVAAARRRAATEPAAAGGLLARALLLRYGRLDVASSERLLGRTLRRLGVVDR